jgi:hypothetical protein
MWTRLTLVLVCLGAAAGCGDGNGVDVGRFEVEAVRTESCGEAGLLASLPAMTWKVFLRRVGDDGMHWEDIRDRMMGLYDAEDRSFAIEENLVVDMRQGQVGQPDCRIARRHRIDGVLDSEPELAVSFTAEQRFDYEPTDGSACDDLLEGPTAIADHMPCSVVYDLAGAR